MLKTNNPVTYSDPTGLAPKKEKRSEVVGFTSSRRKRKTLKDD